MKQLAFLSLIFATLLLINSTSTATESTNVPTPSPEPSSSEWAQKSVNPPQHRMTAAFNSTSTVTPFPSLSKLDCLECGKRCLKVAHKQQQCFKNCAKRCRKGNSAVIPPSTINCNEQCGTGRRCAHVPLCVQRCGEFCGTG